MKKDEILVNIKNRTILNYDMVKKVYDITKSYDEILKIYNLSTEYGIDIIELAKFLHRDEK